MIQAIRIIDNDREEQVEVDGGAAPETASAFSSFNGAYSEDVGRRCGLPAER